MPTHATQTGAETLTNKTIDLSTASGNVVTHNAATTNAAAPTGTTSATGVHVGLGLLITPRSTGRVLVVVTGQCTNTSITADAFIMQVRHGTGSAPTNGAALTGTADGLTQRTRCDNSLFESCGTHAVVTGLTLNTQYWFDISQARAAIGTSSIENVLITAVEI